MAAVGRSREKAQALRERFEATGRGGTLRTDISDLSLLAVAQDTARRIAADVGHLDYVVNSAGVLLTRTAHTSEGLELDFAVGYLARVVFVDELHRLGAIDRNSRMVTISAAGPRVPRFARMEFDEPAAVKARTGLRSHGQAQLANDLWTARAADLYGCAVVGYGPGAVDTAIRREVPRWVQRVLAPVFTRSTRDPAEVATQLLEILGDPGLRPGSVAFADRTGYFTPDAYVRDARRQANLLRVTRLLVAEVLGSDLAPDSRTPADPGSDDG